MNRGGVVRGEHRQAVDATFEARLIALVHEATVVCFVVGGVLMTSESDDLGKALQENLKLRRELATGLAEAKGERLAAVRYRLARTIGAVRHVFSGRIRRASVSKAVVELMTLDGAREQYANQLRRLDREALLKEIEQLRRLLQDLASRDNGFLK